MHRCSSLKLQGLWPLLLFLWHTLLRVLGWLKDIKRWFWTQHMLGIWWWWCVALSGWNHWIPTVPPWKCSREQIWAEKHKFLLFLQHSCLGAATIPSCSAVLASLFFTSQNVWKVEAGAERSVERAEFWGCYFCCVFWDSWLILLWKSPFLKKALHTSPSTRDFFHSELVC